MPDNLKQAYENLQKAYLKLQQFLKEDNNTELSRAGILHAYEFTFELFWKFLQKYLENISIIESYGPASVIRTAFENNIISDGQNYMDMLRDRNLITHTYKEDIANEIYVRIKQIHANTLSEFIETFDKKII